MFSKLTSALTFAAFTAALILFGAATILTLGRAVASAVTGSNRIADPQPVSAQREKSVIPIGKGKEGTMEKATFGAGCFWGVEAAFRQVNGVSDTAVGYMGGTLPNPTYRDVCTGRTGHAEVVQVTYDPARVSYEKLLQVFWDSHDPTQQHRQGPDVGAQYRSAIFYHTPEQKAAADASKQALHDSGRYPKPVVTEITPAPEFYRAEEYHQRYLEKQGLASCGISL